MRISILIFCFLIQQVLIGQTTSDSTVFTYKSYLENVIRYHPIAKKADLQTKIGAANWLAAKGNLDPKLGFSWNEKDFDEKLYYRQYAGKVKVPTTLGIDVVGGYENTAGEFLNPENKTDKNGLWHLGVEVNLLQGLIVNERKIALEQAKVFQSRTDNERLIILNELLYAASKAYLDWQKYFYFQTVYQENINIANTYFTNTKLSFESGEKTAMDTLEAFILYQDANNAFQKNELSLVAARQNLENYLWLDEKPVVLQAAILPENYQNDFFQPNPDFNFDTAINTHPLLQTYVYKQSYFELEQRLKREKLKPKLKVKYNPLLSTSDNSIAPNFSLSNFKWGLDFSMPLLFRSEKAAIQQGDIKLQETALDFQNKQNELSNKATNSLQQQTILNDQIALSQQNLEGYRLLLEGENLKFQYGESSVFLLNKRQEKYINGQLKLIELFIKRQKEILSFYFYTNQLLER